VRNRLRVAGNKSCHPFLSVHPFLDTTIFLDIQNGLFYLGDRAISRQGSEAWFF
jgi:hypothetical protein